MKYTPGPWKVRANDNCKQIFAVNREKVACTSGLWDYEEDLGNALLISAAPDMYEMLKEVVDTLELVDPGVYTGTINQNCSGHAPSKPTP